MMTRIVQNIQTGKVLSLTKGADSAIISRCIPRKLMASVKNQGKIEEFNEEEKSIVHEVEEFAAQGFRTLAFAMKELETTEIDGVLTQ